MNKLITLGVIVGIFVILGFILGGMYNGLVGTDNKVDKAWADVETQYQRRFDLIDNLVETVKGYAEFEQETLVKVTEARAAAFGAMKKVDENGVEQFIQANNQLGIAMRGMLGYQEKYPDLRANKNFLELQAQLEGTENRIAVSRERYNEAVEKHNNKVEKFPTNIIANSFGISERDMFESVEAANVAPKVDF